MMSVLTVQLGIEVNLTKREERLCLESSSMRLQKTLQFRVAGFASRGQVFRNKFKLLPEPAAHDHVVTVESQNESFAVRSFLANVVGNQPLEFVPGWCAISVREPATRATREDGAARSLPASRGRADQDGRGAA